MGVCDRAIVLMTVCHGKVGCNRDGEMVAGGRSTRMYVGQLFLQIFC